MPSSSLERHDAWSAFHRVPISDEKILEVWEEEKFKDSVLIYMFVILICVIMLPESYFNIFGLMTELTHKIHVHCQAFVYPVLSIAWCALEIIQNPFKTFLTL